MTWSRTLRASESVVGGKVVYSGWVVCMPQWEWLVWTAGEGEGSWGQLQGPSVGWRRWVLGGTRGFWQPHWALRTIGAQEAIQYGWPAAKTLPQWIHRSMWWRNKTPNSPIHKYSPLPLSIPHLWQRRSTKQAYFKCPNCHTCVH